MAEILIYADQKSDWPDFFEKKYNRRKIKTQITGYLPKGKKIEEISFEDVEAICIKHFKASCRKELGVTVEEFEVKRHYPPGRRYKDHVVVLNVRLDMTKRDVQSYYDSLDI